MYRQFALSLLFVVSAAAYSVPVDVEISVAGGNQSFESDRTAVDTDLPTDSFSFGGSALAAVTLTDGVELVTEYQRSPILGNLARVTFRQTDQFVSVAAGVVIGVANTSRALFRTGVYSRIRFDIAGLLYTEFISERTLRANPVAAGDYAMDSLDLRTGVYLPNALFTLRYRSTTRETRTEAAVVLDTESEYVAEVDIFAKNVPYRALLSFGYRTTAKSFDDVRQAIGFLIFGTSLEIDITDSMTYTLGVDSSVYTFGRNALVGQFANDRYVFRAHLGSHISFEALAPSP